MKPLKPTNPKFMNSLVTNNEIYQDYCYRLRKIALNIYKWENIPSSMDYKYLEKTLFYFGSAAILNVPNLGYINTKASSAGYINIYDNPTRINCFSNLFTTERPVYQGFKTDEDKKDACILVKNNIDNIPTVSTIQIFAYKLYEADTAIITNIKNQKTPYIILADKDQKLTIDNLFSQVEGNVSKVILDKNQMGKYAVSTLDLRVDFIADKLMEYKTKVWNEFLGSLGVNNLPNDKKERQIVDEVNSNNEFTNINLLEGLDFRRKACNEFNEYFNMPEDKKINVKINSDLYNLVKTTESAIIDVDKDKIKSLIEEGGKLNG